MAVKVRPTDDGERRLEGRLVAADDESIILETGDGQRRQIRLEVVDRARTVFDWGAAQRRRNGARPADPARAEGGSGR